jgi:uncharacterized lipoprotein
MKPIRLLLLTLLATGCALTEAKVHLTYAQQPGVARLAGADAITATVIVTDVRPDTTRVSSKKNGFGIEMAAISSDAPLSDIVGVAISQELAARGLKLGPKGQITVLVEVTRFWNDFKMGFFAGDAVADFQISAQVKNADGNIRYAHNFAVNGKEANIQLASGDNAELALNRALEEGLRQLFADPVFLAAIVPPTS